MDSTPPSTPSRKHQHAQLGGPPLLSPSLALPPRLTRPLSSLSIHQRSSPSSSRPSSTRPPSIASSFEISLDSLPNQDPASTEDSNSAEDELTRGGSSVASGSTSPTTLQPSDHDARSSSEKLGNGEGNGDVGKALREQLKRSLSGRPGTYAGKGKARAQDVFDDDHLEERVLSPDVEDLPEEPSSSLSRFTPRKYYVLTDAGKPVYASSDEGDLNTIVGVIQTLISIFLEDEGDKLRCITSGDSKIAFLLRPPLYYACVSTWREPESVLRVHLEYLHLQVLSIITGGQLKRIFTRRGNFDLRRLLEGTDSFFSSLIDTLQHDFSFLSHSLEPLRINPLHRAEAGQALLLSSKSKGLLYSLILAGPSLNPVTLLRPKKHSIHPTDLHLLLNLIRSSPALRQVDNESWLPICLPKFNQEGFLHVYVTFVRENVGLVWVSSDKGAFEELREGRRRVCDRLESTSLLDRISEAIPAHPFGVGELNIPGLRHFFYKSCTNVQLTQPRWEAPYDDLDEQRRLLTHYQRIHDALHSRSCPGAEPLSLLYVRTTQESILGWFTQPFELYLTLPASFPKTGCVSVANKVARWIRKEEGSLFLKDAPVF